MLISVSKEQLKVVDINKKVLNIYLITFKHLTDFGIKNTNQQNLKSNYNSQKINKNKEANTIIRYVQKPIKYSTNQSN